MIPLVNSKQMDEDLISDVAEFAALFSEKGLEDVKLEVVREAKGDGIEKMFLRLSWLKHLPRI